MPKKSGIFSQPRSTTDTMRSRHLPMPFEEFERMPRELGWKFEYWNGHAHISPGHQVVVAALPTAPRPVDAPCPIRPLAVSDRAGLVAAYVAAFGDTIEFCDQSPREVAESADSGIERFLLGKRGRPHPASRVAIAPGSGLLAGAALIVDAGPEEALLDMLFIVPGWQHRGLGTALVGAAMNLLHKAGVGNLESAYVLGNAPSRAWHRKFGFKELPDLTLARHYAHHYTSEVRRLRLLGTSLPAELRKFEALREHWRNEAARLDRIADREGYEAVTPLLRRNR
jgi:N-acetylglutamate synthase-like GNAT family acetyltransferase